MACCVNYISPPRASLSPPPSRSSFSFPGDAVHSLLREPALLLRRHSRSPSIVAPRFQVVAAEKAEPPLKIMISGAPASGKGTQCELITQKYGLVHISAGDLLRAEIASGSGNGKLAKEYMEKGQLVPDEIVVMMVKDRLSQTDSQQNGWLLDGYPRSSSQATALKGFGFQPDLFIVLEVPEDILIERVVGPHMKLSAKLRLKTHNQNVSDVLSMYDDITIKIKGNRSKEEVFAQIDTALSKMLQQRNNTSPSSLSS
ncbi:BnaCnng41710D [Brassica napus]|uniref:adenylate kinase n=1 Tax=Brassica napus TaxID=3708 RepID=A0A078JB69_BRANA|nr:BnaCnng41710D [Brassica napus]